MSKGSLFKFKEDPSKEVRIHKDEVEEILPDADFRFSLIILKNGDKHFVCGIEKEIWEELEKTA
jgi:hypothetical protein